ncbi:hypothetical protein [Bacillus sp. T33-2]|uniref:hypothetical protein n=1 Tax=Bacillus sp. T33-2 TaxID=2054168 RepID=UPI001159B34C|nr:hypothetical protein [Bacillus sp. T33-2]
MSFSKRVREKIESVTFCYAKEGGEGFVYKEKCACGTDKCCQAIQDKERFHQRFNELSMVYGDFSKRDEIIKIIKPEFENSKWWKDNVIE